MRKGGPGGVILLKGVNCLFPLLLKSDPSGMKAWVSVDPGAIHEPDSKPRRHTPMPPLLFHFCPVWSAGIPGTADSLDVLSHRAVQKNLQQ
jgi:hypothetical protein